MPLRVVLCVCFGAARFERRGSSEDTNESDLLGIWGLVDFLSQLGEMEAGVVSAEWWENGDVNR